MDCVGFMRSRWGGKFTAGFAGRNQDDGWARPGPGHYHPPSPNNWRAPRSVESGIAATVLLLAIEDMRVSNDPGAIDFLSSHRAAPYFDLLGLDQVACLERIEWEKYARAIVNNDWGWARARPGARGRIRRNLSDEWAA